VAPVANPLELPAVTLPVLDGTEDSLAEQTIPLRLERSIVDRFRLGDLAIAPGADLLRKSIMFPLSQTSVDED
jgi:hypothetical protein